MNLETINYSAYTYARQTFSEFNKIITPLSHLGINHFGYFRIYDDGRYKLLSNNINVLKIHLQKVVRNDDVFNKHIALTSLLKKHIFTLEFDDNLLRQNSNEVVNTLLQYNILHEICICRQKDANSIEAFVFTNTTLEKQTHEYYMNNIFLLEKFIDYFVQAGKHLLYGNNNNFAYSDQTYDFNKPSIEWEHQQRVNNFIKSIESFNTSSDSKFEVTSSQNLSLLSKRERECLFHLSLGRTAKETAQFLDLKFRTVERYIDIIRVKTGCHRKGELIKLFTGISNASLT